ncbi:hypothetical protein ABPG74_016490 [Tetrahymena malaccensis]
MNTNRIGLTNIQQKQNQILNSAQKQSFENRENSSTQRNYIVKKIKNSRGLSIDHQFNNQTQNSIQKDKLDFSYYSTNINSPFDSQNSTPNQKSPIQNNETLCFQDINTKNQKCQMKNYLCVEQENQKTLTPSPRDGKQNTTSRVEKYSPIYSKIQKSPACNRRFSVSGQKTILDCKQFENKISKNNSDKSNQSIKKVAQDQDQQLNQQNIRDKMKQPQQQFLTINERRRSSISNSYQINQFNKNKLNQNLEVKFPSQQIQNEIEKKQIIEEDNNPNQIFSFAYDSYDHSQLEILNNDEQLDSSYLSDFIEVNRNYLEENLQVCLTADKSCVDLYQGKSSFIDVMVSIELPEKNQQVIEPFVDAFRRNQQDQIKKHDIILSRNQGVPLRNKIYNTRDYITSPYDLIIVLDVNMNQFVLKQVLDSIEFIISNSNKNDRISLIIPIGSKILKSNLMRCSNAIKKTLVDVLQKVQTNSKLSNHRSLLNAFWTIKEKKYENYQTSVFWYSYGQITKSFSEQIQDDLIHLNIKNSFSFYNFHIKNPHDDSINYAKNLFTDSFSQNYLQNLSHMNGGYYYFIENGNQIAQFSAKALGSVKTLVGFKVSATVSKCLNQQAINRNQIKSNQNKIFLDDKSNNYIPSAKIDQMYGGDAVWRENENHQEYSIDLSQINSGISRQFNLRFSFQGTSIQISKENGQHQVFKAHFYACHENLYEEQKYIIRDSILQLNFRNHSIQNSPQVAINNEVIKNSYKYKLLPELIEYLKLIEKGEHQYAAKKLEESINYINNLFNCSTNLANDNLIKFTESLKHYQKYPEDLSANKKYEISAFLQSQLLQKAETFQKKMNYEISLSEYSMNYMQFYLQGLAIQNICK